MLQAPELFDAPTYAPPPPPVLRGEDHPLWQAQVEMEMGMMREGADRVRDRVIKATEGKTMTRLQPVRKLLSEWLPRVAEAITEWSRSYARTKAPKPIALRIIRDADHYVLGLVATRTILDSIMTHRGGLTGTCMEIGRACEHELMIREWAAKDPESFRNVQTYLDRTDSTSSHRRLANINRFNALLQSDDPTVSWVKWGGEMQLRVGLALVDCVTRATGWFDLVPDPNFVFRPGQKKGPKSVLVPKPALVEWLGQALDREELTSPVFKPTVIPPKPWTSTKGGAYWTHYVRTPRLIRFKAHQVDQQDRAADEYEALDMPQVYESINWLQDRPWRINRRVLDVVMASWNAKMGLGGLPVDEELERPGLLPGPYLPEDLKKHKRAMADTIRRDLKRFTEVEGVKRVLGVAHEYRDYEHIYFPHMLDFRGRMYPIPVGLQPQGDDLARSLLEFGVGKVVEHEQDVGWLAVALSAAWGFDKASFEDRITWVQEREDLWRRIAADPLNNLEWAAKGVDKPWGSLAAILEYVACLDHGLGYVTHLPCSVDGTCNGIQHLSAMTRDEVAGRHVNLVPGDKPRDIYQFVADRLAQDLVDIRDGGGAKAPLADYWLRLTNAQFHRSLTKRQVMVIPYGGSKEAFFGYTGEWLDEHDPLPQGLDWSDPETKAMLKERAQRIGFLSDRLWLECGITCSGGVTVMKWLQDCAKATVAGGRPIFWTTPSGFVVRHFYGKQLERKVETVMDGQRVQLRINETTDVLDGQSQLRGIAPNFVHSLDAAALSLSLLAAKERGIEGFTCVHDAYGTHATDMWPLYHILREAFVLVHATDMLAEFRKACASVVVAKAVADDPDGDFLETAERAEESLPAMPRRGKLDLGDVLSSDYFFA